MQYESLRLQCDQNSMPVCHTFTRLCILFKVLYGDVLYLNPPYTIVTWQYESRLLNSHQITVQFARSTYFKLSFFPVYTTALWNYLKFDTSEIGSIGSFKSKLLIQGLLLFVLFVACLVLWLQINIGSFS